MIMRALLCLFLFVATSASAQTWPSKPIRLIVASGAGTATDTIARLYTGRLGDALGQPVPIDNRPGGGGIAAMEAVAKSAPDGHTLLGAPGGIMVAGPHLYKVSFDIAKELEPVSPVSRASMFLVVRPGLPVKTVADLVAHARANPGKLNYSSGGSGSTPHLAGVMLARVAKVDIVHVPYKTTAQAMNDVLSGQIDFIFDPGAVVGHIKSGKVRLLAVARPTRSPFFPDTPTMAEAGAAVDVAATTMTGLYAPTGMPRDIVARLNREVARIVTSPELRGPLAGVGAEAATATPEQFAAEVARERERFGVIIREANIKAD
jgi:tripartite-type tricarboxylate transporter receptor subunit TctC